MKAISGFSRYFFVILAGLLAVPAGADETVTDTRSERLDVTGVEHVEFHNLAGAVSLSRASGDTLEITAKLSATGDDEEEAREYLALLDLDIERDGDELTVLGIYPVDEYDRYSYSREGWSWGYNTSTSYMGERVSISSSRGLEVHIDFDVAVPDGLSLDFENKVGTIKASGVNGDLALDTSSGSIDVLGGSGRTVADTGSGSVDIRDRDGEVVADTGSGGIEIRNVTGNVTADTGSGSVDITAVRGNINVDTGSGGVDLEDIAGDILVDTGSGGVEGVGLSSVTELEIDTGSGSVELDGDLSALEDMRIDTGSGGVRIRTEGTLNMRLVVSAGSGGVEVDLPNMSNVRSDRGDFQADIGNGKGRGEIDTGSGGVRISTRR